MVLARKMETVAKLSLRDVCLVAEAWVGLLVARSILAVLPFRFYMRPRRGRSFEGPVSADVVRQVGWAVRCAARNTPFDAKCLAQAMAAKAMLARRRHASVLHLGVKPGEDLAAHAWLTVGAITVVGGEGQGFGEVARFGARPEPMNAPSAIQPDANGAF